MQADGRLAPTDPVYEEFAASSAALAAKRAAAREARSAALVARSDPATRLGYDPLIVTEGPPPPSAAKIFAARRTGLMPVVDSWDRLFGPGEPINVDARRQRLRNSLTNGRAGDIITGAAYEYFPPSAPERVTKRQAHPSMQNQAFR